MPLYPGDPLTPGVGATKNAKRLPIAEAKTILKIPVMPISYADAQPLLAALGGPVAPAGWRGALPITYHLGPGPAKVHLAISSDWGQKPLYDVIAKIPRQRVPDEWVVRGNHRDGWVFGAWDPLSGHVAMMAEAKAIGALLKTGWKPKRTLVYASWDGEEPACSARPSGPRPTPRSCSRRRCCTSTPTPTRAASSRAGAATRCSACSTSGGAGEGPRDRRRSVQARLRARLLVAGLRQRRARSAEEKAGCEGWRRRAATCRSGRSAPARTSRLSAAPGTHHAQHRVRWRGRSGWRLSLELRHVRALRALRRPGLRLWRRGGADRGHVVLRMADAAVLPLQFTDFAATIGDYVDELHKLADDKRSAPPSSTSCSTRAPSS